MAGAGARLGQHRTAAWDHLMVRERMEELNTQEGTRVQCRNQSCFLGRETSPTPSNNKSRIPTEIMAKFQGQSREVTKGCRLHLIKPGIAFAHGWLNNIVDTMNFG